MDAEPREPIKSLRQLAAAEEACTRCPLYRDATQAVPGEGPRRATFMLVGEQPGDKEDLAGKPFVGPAGRMLDSALHDAGIAREETFVTNAVKHFKHEMRGKRRLHKRPNNYEIERCKIWLDDERKLVKPSAVIALGVTAARSLTGKTVTIGKIRGKALISRMAPSSSSPCTRPRCYASRTRTINTKPIGNSSPTSKRLRRQLHDVANASMWGIFGLPHRRVIASQRVRPEVAGPMTGSAKQSRAAAQLWIASSRPLLAMTAFNHPRRSARRSAPRGLRSLRPPLCRSPRRRSRCRARRRASSGP